MKRAIWRRMATGAGGPACAPRPHELRTLPCADLASDGLDEPGSGGSEGGEGEEDEEEGLSGSSDEGEEGLSGEGEEGTSSGMDDDGDEEGAGEGEEAGAGGQQRQRAAGPSGRAGSDSDGGGSDGARPS
jgi:hypothetical protein